jgi:hypothetical protein
LTPYSHTFYFPKKCRGKRWDPFDAWKVPHSKKHAKKIHFAVLKPNERELFRKEVQVLIKLSNI